MYPRTDIHTLTSCASTIRPEVECVVRRPLNPSYWWGVKISHFATRRGCGHAAIRVLHMVSIRKEKTKDTKGKWEGSFLIRKIKCSYTTSSCNSLFFIRLWQEGKWASGRQAFGQEKKHFRISRWNCLWVSVSESGSLVTMATWLGWAAPVDGPPVYPEPSPEADDSVDQPYSSQIDGQKRPSENVEDSKIPTFGAEPWRQNTSRFQQIRDVLSTEKLRERWTQATSVVCCPKS